MSTERVLPIQFPEKRAAQVAQCPSCFTLNLVDVEDDFRVTCLLCGSHYNLLSNNSKAAA